MTVVKILLVTLHWHMVFPFVTYFFIENIFYSLGVYLLLLASFINRLSFPDVDKTQKLPE